MTLRELQYLVELARLRNFRRAAEVCNVSQPTLSTQLRKLEESLGVQLVERSKQQVLLTPVGEEIVARAQKMLDEARDIRAIAERNRAPDTGRLRLGAFPTLGPYILPALLPEIARGFPNLQLQLFEEKSETLLGLLRSGDLDAALLALPIEDPTLQTTPLFEEPFLLAVPRGHRLASSGPLHLADLGAEEMMLLEDGHCLRDQAVSICNRWGLDEIEGFRATSLETLRQMVAAGMGITLLPQLATEGPMAQSTSMSLIPLADTPTPGRQIGMVWRRSSYMVPLLRQIARITAQTAKARLGANRSTAA
ncbi:MULTISPECIES: LysR substrate-binding domain-containing protein [Thioclava]|uniref:LysR substrate-binding domain-containing protein n=1 Tax=Thioclava kandeliae TaxID=3070818 RepID=A0ABV1SKK4_9RHOB